MSNQFTVNFTVNNVDYSVTIECLDNPVIDRWYESIKQVYQDTPNITFNHHPNHRSESTKQSNIDFITTTYNELLQAIEDFEKIGVHWPIVEPREFNFDQQWCNRTHRFFTTLTQYRKFYMDTDEVISSRDPNINEFYKLGHIVNDCIHKIESYCVNETRQKYFMASKTVLVNVPELDFDLYKTHTWHKFNEDDYKYHSWDHDCDVIFEAEILGKSIFCSFGDEDDPNYFDTSGHHGWFGSFLILANDARKKIYASEYFDSWLTQHGVSKQSPTIKGDFPIGRIIKTSTPDFRTLDKPRPNEITNCSIVFNN
jgi:hypothetical protein